MKIRFQLGLLLILIIETIIVTVSAQINLVPQGVAVQRTTYLDRNANLAIEGPANNEWADGCSATAAGQEYAWWGLQLPAVAHMTNFLIYYRKDTPFRMDGFRLYLENGTADQSSTSGLCYTDQGIPGYPAITQNLTCNMLAENMYFVNRRNNFECYVELCYVAIYACDESNGIGSGCWKGTWGRNCSELCPPNCINQNCYPETGLCVWGCDAHNCLNNQCDNKTGSCTDGCAIGQAGQYCNKQCENGFYGFNCKEQCATCFNMSCERLEGNCSFGCIDERYEGVRCQTLVNGEKNTRDNNSSASIGGGIGAVVFIIVVVAILIIIYRRRSKPRKEKNIRNQDKISKSEENTYCNHNAAFKTEDLCLNLDSEPNLAKEKPPFAGKTESKTSVIEVIDEYPEEYDEEEEGNVYNNIPSEKSITQYKIPIADLKKVINEKRKEEGFKNEYELLHKGLVHAHSEGSKEENKVKNRFLTTWPYDHSRVVLTRDNKYDYINASYIDSYSKEKAYIATQGPKKNTIRDFWHMIWQENVCKIVMVTQLEEGRRKKCEQYWPESVDQSTIVDNFKLTMTKEKYHTVFVYRLIIVYNKTNKQERKVHHFHFTEWPDHGVPDSVKLVTFYRKVKSITCDMNGPMVVHCSAGVGRTGTFIAVDALYENSRNVGFIDIMEYVQMMRKDRMNMIQTHEQYEIVFEALLELFTVPDTSIEKNDFCGQLLTQDNKTLPKNQTMYSEEFQRLQTLRPSYSAKSFTAANSKENKTKNSSTAVLAHDNYRPYLMSYSNSRSDYLNAVMIPGYASDSKMYVTQCPLVETVIDFWTMIYDHSSRIIVLLDPENKGAPLWLDKKEMLQFDNFIIIKETENSPEEPQLTLHHTKNKEQISINVFTAKDWTISNAPPSPEYMLYLLQRVQTCWETHKCPITVVCRDGCSKSGLFVALKLILYKMQIDEEIDIFQVVRELQTRRPEFLVEFDQYEFCYKLVRVQLEGDPNDSVYANT